MTDGKAYAFFNCRASKGEIDAELPDIRRLSGTPEELHLYVEKGVGHLKGNSGLMALARRATDAGLRYSMEATLPGATNRETADEAAAVLNQAYQTDLWRADNTFEGEISFEEGGRYVMRK